MINRDFVNQRVYDHVAKVLSEDISKYIYKINKQVHLVEGKTAKEAYEKACKLHGENGHLRLFGDI